VPEIRRFTTPEASLELLAAIRRMLDAAFEGDFSDDDWDHALGGVHAAALEGDAVLAHASVVSRVLEVADQPLRAGYVEAVATDAAHRHRRLGTAVMEVIGDALRADYELGALATGAFGFYATLGWERWRGPTYVRDGGETTRTSWEDGGIMVLRFGPSADADLTAPLTCEARPGDDW
jgi:aminoglycoside 2'-N-acetyltransferase I